MLATALALALFCSTWEGEQSELCDDNGLACTEGGACYEDTQTCEIGDTLCLETGEDCN